MVVILILIVFIGYIAIAMTSNSVVEGFEKPILIENYTLVQAVTKRINVNRNGFNTDYFVTFEVDSDGRRVELQVMGTEFGMIVEGDSGTLKYTGEINSQNMKFVKFERIIEKNKEEEVGK